MINDLKDRAIVISALQQEFDACPLTIYTGVGKINATFITAQAIHVYSPSLVINLGTAGSKKFNKGELVTCNKFVQRDMMYNSDKKFITPVSSEKEIFEYGMIDNSYQQAICGTGDSFVENLSQDEIFDIVDMEAFAIAKVCERFGVPMLCVKYISDGADDSANLTWEESLKEAKLELNNWYRNFVRGDHKNVR